MYYAHMSSDRLATELSVDRRGLYNLLTKVNEAKERFAGPRQMFEEAAKLRDIERKVQQRLKVGE